MRFGDRPRFLVGTRDGTKAEGGSETNVGSFVYLARFSIPELKKITRRAVRFLGRERALESLKRVATLISTKVTGELSDLSD